MDVNIRWPTGQTTQHDSIATNSRHTLSENPNINRFGIVFGNTADTVVPGAEIEVTARAIAEHNFSHWSSSSEDVVFEDALATTTTLIVPSGVVSIQAHFLPGKTRTHEVSLIRQWNEVLLAATRNDFARPTVHARNLFHLSSAIYDSWSHIAGKGQPWQYGNTRFASCEINSELTFSARDKATNIAISHVAYELIKHRFGRSPGRTQTRRYIETLLERVELQYSTHADWQDAKELGESVAECYINFGLQDGSNELNDYANLYYEPVNDPLSIAVPGNPTITDLNRWQPLNIANFVDQSGNRTDSTPQFIGPEWGNVEPFALRQDDATLHFREDGEYWLYLDQGPPPRLDEPTREFYQWAHSLVSIWSSHLDPEDGIEIDISPKRIRSGSDYPIQLQEYRDFYEAAAATSNRPVVREINPISQEPYEEQLVLAADYRRVLAEYWADGPDSETPPGHWFVLLNAVADEIDTTSYRIWFDTEDVLEQDAKAYFLLGGTVHDAAIAAWSHKGWYDYIRPVSSIRAMAGLGQSSDSALPNYHKSGIPLVPGFIELINDSDELAGDDGEYIDEIKLKSWRGPGFGA